MFQNHSSLASEKGPSCTCFLEGGRRSLAARTDMVSECRPASLGSLARVRRRQKETIPTKGLGLIDLKIQQSEAWNRLPSPWSEFLGLKELSQGLGGDSRGITLRERCPDNEHSSTHTKAKTKLGSDPGHTPNPEDELGLSLQSPCGKFLCTAMF